jgi:hypothetical protein
MKRTEQCPACRQRESEDVDVAALKALPTLWRARAQLVNQPDSPSIYVDCAEELEEALEL